MAEYVLLARSYKFQIYQGIDQLMIFFLASLMDIVVGLLSHIQHLLVLLEGMQSSESFHNRASCLVQLYYTPI